jgi:plasmid stabilization system protein ParE
VRKIILFSGARTDLDEAARFYDAQEPGLGRAFSERFEEAVNLIREFPFIAPKIYRSHRRLGLDPFMYGIIYSVEQEEIPIIAVAHNRRDDDFWKKRI